VIAEGFSRSACRYSADVKAICRPPAGAAIKKNGLRFRIEGFEFAAYP
jgi:hypothetical protein